MKQITAWSNSRLALYERCPAQFAYRHIHKLPFERNDKAERGIRIHEGFAKHLTGEEDEGSAASMSEAKALRKFHVMLAEIKANTRFVEEKWAFDKDWRLANWFDKRVRYRSVIDVGVMWPDNAFSIVDWKTGRPYEDSADQMEQFAMSAFAALRSVNWIETRLAYVDTGQEIHAEFTRAQFPKLVEKWERRAAPLLNDQTFAPRPGPHCKGKGGPHDGCPFAKSKGGPCAYG